MEVLRVWKVPAGLTATFRKRMRDEKNLHQDSPATILNSLCGYNYFYETDESFGDVTDLGAESICRNYNVKMYDFEFEWL